MYFLIDLQLIWNSILIHYQSEAYLRNTLIYSDDQLLYIARSTSIFNKNFVVRDTYGHELLTIKQKIGFFKMKYIIIENGYEIALVTKPALDKKFVCEGDMSSFSVEGNFLNTQYDIFENHDQVAKVSRKLFKMKKSYGIAVDAEVDQISVLCLCIILAIVNVMRQKS